MPAKLKTFVGFRGTSAFAEISGIRFVILASTPAQLEKLWAGILSQAGPFDPSMCKKAILIESANLPESKPKPIEPQPEP